MIMHGVSEVHAEVRASRNHAGRAGDRYRWFGRSTQQFGAKKAVSFPFTGPAAFTKFAVLECYE